MFDPESALFFCDVIAFIQKTQPDERQYLASIQKGKAEETPLDDVCRAGREGYSKAHDLDRR